MIQWDKICQPKDRDGLGLKKATDMNKAILAKRYWRLHVEMDSLWNFVLKKKYDIWKPLRSNSGQNLRSSVVWQSINWFGELVDRGLGWRVKNGGRILFWLDHWIDDGPLRDLAMGPNSFRRTNATCVQILGSWS